MSRFYGSLSICLSALVSSTLFLKNQLYLLSSRNQPWISINSQTTAQSPTYLSYPKSSNVLSNLDFLNTSLLAIFSTLTSLRTVNITLTETALLYIHDHLINATGSQKISCPCLIDLSASFDTTDHKILITGTRLSYWFGLHGSVLEWFKSYLSDRLFSCQM